jgi:hypothetical protein
MRRRALNSRSFPVLRNPNNASHSIAFWTLDVIAYVDYILVSPLFFIVHAVFFLIVTELEWVICIFCSFLTTLFSECPMLFSHVDLI